MNSTRPHPQEGSLLWRCKLQAYCYPPLFKIIRANYLSSHLFIQRVTSCCRNVIQVSAYDRSLSSGIVFVDISKTFDRVIYPGWSINCNSQKYMDLY